MEKSRHARLHFLRGAQEVAPIEAIRLPGMVSLQEHQLSLARWHSAVESVDAEIRFTKFRLRRTPIIEEKVLLLRRAIRRGHVERRHHLRGYRRLRQRVI